MSAAGGRATAGPERRERTSIAGLYVLADDDPRWRHDPVAQARAALAGGARLVQLRAKHASDPQALRWAASIRDLCRARGALFFLNDRFDLALAAGADGVHLGQDDVPPDGVPVEARARLRIGRSTHTLDQARAACREPIDYVAFGPVFGTASKVSPYSARGIDALGEVARCVAPLPLVAIGGIDDARAGEVVRAGAAAVCAISAVAGADDMEGAARAMVRAIEAVRA
ncbi:MAG TPA: thiamine phosphate synthase [Myxococcota bacterium]|nr:thiamine phosphate synthase [Myxococcota bacterium]